MMKKFVSMSDIVDGAEFVEICEGNKIILKNGVEKAIIRVSEQEY